MISLRFLLGFWRGSEGSEQQGESPQQQCGGGGGLGWLSSFSSLSRRGRGTGSRPANTRFCPCSHPHIAPATRLVVHLRYCGAARVLPKQTKRGGRFVEPYLVFGSLKRDSFMLSYFLEKTLAGL